MPTYGYECTHCGHNFEMFQGINDAALDKCPKCGSKVKRLIDGGMGIIFKGAGFYATDYRKKSESKPEDKPVSSCPKANEGCAGCPHGG